MRAVHLQPGSIRTVRFLSARHYSVSHRGVQVEQFLNKGCVVATSGRFSRWKER